MRSSVFRSFDLAAFATSGSASVNSLSAVCISPNFFKKFSDTSLGTLVLVVWFSLVWPRGAPGRLALGRPLEPFVTISTPAMLCFLSERCLMAFFAPCLCLQFLLHQSHSKHRITRGASVCE